MKKWRSAGITTLLSGLLLLLAMPPFAAGQTPGMSRLQNDDPNNWPMYHRSYDSFRYSPLAQINKDNVKNLSVAWVHQPGALVQGLESTPLVVDGVMYYIASYNRVFALDAATGKELWHFYPKLDPVVNTLFFQSASVSERKSVSVVVGMACAAPLLRLVASAIKAALPVKRCRRLNIDPPDRDVRFNSRIDDPDGVKSASRRHHIRMTAALVAAALDP